MNPLRAKIEYTLVALLAWKARWLPLWLSRAGMTFLGWLAASMIGFRRKVALENLRHSFPELNKAQLISIYKRCWQHFARVGAELARLPRVDKSFINKNIDLSSQVVLREAIDEGKGVIVVSGHFGNWEWMGGMMAKIGYPITYVVTDQSNPLVDEWIDRMRISVGIEIIRRKDAIRGVLTTLKKGRVVAILCDQDAGKTGAFTEFFGRPASTPRGPALFHLRTQAPMVFSCCPREASGKYRLITERMSFPDLNGDREHDEHAIMQQITTRLEKAVREYPEQWLWLHRRWKTKAEK